MEMTKQIALLMLAFVVGCQGAASTSGKKDSPDPAKSVTEQVPVAPPVPKRSDAETLAAIGAPDDALNQSLEQAPLKDVEARLAFVIAGRLAALRRGVQIGGTMAEIGLKPFLVPTSKMELFLAELDDSPTAPARLAVLKKWVASATDIEMGVRAVHETGANFRSAGTLSSAVAARLKVEERLVREILELRAAKERVGKATQPDPSWGQAVFELMTQADASTTLLEAARERDELLAENMERASLKDVESRLILIRAARIAALHQCWQAAQAFQDIEEITIRDVIRAMSDVVEAEMEYIDVAAVRLSELKGFVKSVSQLENETREKMAIGARGGSSLALHQILAARLQAETTLMLELLAQRDDKASAKETPRPVGISDESLTKLLTGDDVTEAIAAVGPPDEAILEGMERASRQDVEARMSLLQAGRLAALYLKLKTIKEYREVGVRGEDGATTTLADVMQVNAELAEGALQQTRTPAIRLSAIKSMVAAAHAMENEVREMMRVGAKGGSVFELYPAIAARLQAETRLLREIIEQRTLAKP